ncbi:MAG: lipopolysaccharide core heptose(I) kinase RfaP [Pseudomonadales bacterium]
MNYIAAELQPHFGEDQLFQQLASLDGEVFREVAGRKTLRIMLDGKPYFAKLHYGVGWWEIAKNLLQARPPVLGARNEWLALRKLASLKINSPEPLLYVDEGMNPARIRSGIVTRALEDMVTLADYILIGRPSFHAKQLLISSLAEMTARLHDGGVNHRDYYLCHMLMPRALAARLDEAPEPPPLYLIDLHRAQIRQRTPLRWRTKDLGGLLFSAVDAGLTRRDLLRFIRHYTGLELRQTLTEDAATWRRALRRARNMYKETHSSVPKPVGKLLAW